MMRGAWFSLLALWHEWRAARWQRVADAGICRGGKALHRSEMHVAQALILRMRAGVAAAKAKQGAP